MRQQKFYLKHIHESQDNAAKQYCVNYAKKQQKRLLRLKNGQVLAAGAPHDHKNVEDVDKIQENKMILNQLLQQPKVLDQTVISMMNRLRQEYFGDQFDADKVLAEPEEAKRP